MMSAIRSDRVPNLLVLQYAPVGRVTNLLLIPSFFFTASSVEKRNPLSPTAQRAGWVGCNIMLSAIAPEGKIRIVNNGQITPAQIVREQFQRVRPLASVLPNLRGWILDVLRVVHAIGRQDFTLQDVYERDSELRALHPNNQNIRAKIRQQLQVLREMRMITFQGRGNYRVV
jgi:type II restriction enzyme